MKEVNCISLTLKVQGIIKLASHIPNDFLYTCKFAWHFYGYHHKYQVNLIIDRELTRLDISIAALQETRLSSSGSLREENYTFFWKGRKPDEPRQHGVGFAVRNTLLDKVQPPHWRYTMNAFSQCI